MNQQTWHKLDQEFAQFPIMKASEVPSEQEIAEAAAAIGSTFLEDYVAFLRRYGGATVGSLPVFGLRPAKVIGNRWSVVELTMWFRNQGWPGVNE